MRLYLTIAILLTLLCGCVTARQDHSDQVVQPYNDTYREDTTVPNKPVFVSLKRTDLQAQPSESNAYLQQISFMLNQILTLVGKARDDNPDDGRVVFDYNTMLLDIQAVQFGINQYLLTHLRAPRLPPPPVNDYSLQGSYVRLRN